MEAVGTNLQGSRGPSDLENQGGSLRERARAAGLTIRLVLDGFTLGQTGGPRERFNNIEALMARLDEVAPHQRLSTPSKSRPTLDETELGRRQKIVAKNGKKPSGRSSCC